VTLNKQNAHKNVTRSLAWTQLIQRIVCYN